MALGPNDSFVGVTAYGSQAESASIFLLSGLFGEIASPADGDYTIVLESPVDYTITSLVFKLASGTTTLSIKKNGSAIAASQSVTSTKATVNLLSSVKKGDLLEFSLSSSSSPVRLAYVLGITRV